MDATATLAPAKARHRLDVLSQLTIAALIGLALSLVFFQALLMRAFDLPLSTFAVLMLLAALLVRTPRRWAPLVGALLAALVVLSNTTVVFYDLTHPETGLNFRFMVVAVALSLVGCVGGLGASIQRFRGSAARTPRGTSVALAALIGLCAGALLIGALPRPAGAGVAPELLAQLPALTTPGMHFDQTELHAQVGEPVALRLANTHGAPHSFDIDELNVHVPAASGQEGLVLFVPEQAGTYTFYCNVPGHREAGMVGTLVVAP